MFVLDCAIIYNTYYNWLRKFHYKFICKTVYGLLSTFYAMGFLYLLLRVRLMLLEYFKPFAELKMEQDFIT